MCRQWGSGVQNNGGDFILASFYGIKPRAFLQSALLARKAGQQIIVESTS